MQLVEIITRVTDTTVPGTFLVEMLPWMEYLPDFLAPWRVWAKKHFREHTAFLERLYRDAKAQIVSIVSSLSE
jgi:hypothetical protein